MSFSVIDAIAIAFMSLLLAFGARAVSLLWKPKTAPAYLGRLAAAFPTSSDASIRRLAAAAPSLVVGMSGLVVGVVGGLVGAAFESNLAAVAGMTVVVTMGLAAFVLGLLTALVVGVFGRPEFVIPPPLRRGAALPPTTTRKRRSSR